MPDNSVGDETCDKYHCVSMATYQEPEVNTNVCACSWSTYKLNEADAVSIRR